ncbi:MAG: RNA methyltransferase [Flavobacteriales bacterium]|nr:RNA methyltransferase [Flavobacteriales bacterium]
MLSKNKLKQINALQRKKGRSENGLFLVEGEKMVDELLTQYFGEGESVYKITDLYYTLPWKMNHLDELEDADFNCEEVTESELLKISCLSSPNQVLAVVTTPTKMLKPLDEELVLMLDGVRDPGNFGTIIRCADWFGIKYIICSTDCVELYNPKVVQATMGSIFRVNVIYTDLPAAIQKIRRNNPLKPVYGASLVGDNIFNMNLDQNAVLVLGSESHGLREDVKEMLTREVMIPRFGQGESLNVAIAAAILCSEFKRY